MGQESSGNGAFTWRHPISREHSHEDIIKAMQRAAFEIVDENDEKVSIQFSGFRLEYALPVFRLVQDNLNGEFVVQGSEDDDRWKLIFANGEIFTAKAVITWGEPVKKDSLKDVLGAN